MESLRMKSFQEYLGRLYNCDSLDSLLELQSSLTDNITETGLSDRDYDLIMNKIDDKLATVGD